MSQPELDLALARIDPAAATAYHRARDRLVARVDQALFSDPGWSDLVGGNPRELVEDNHRNHHRFMASVFHLQNAALVEWIIPWVYRAYQGRGFSPDYFPAVLRLWMDAVGDELPDDAAAVVLATYRWLLGQHTSMLERARTLPALGRSTRPLPPPSRAFLDAALAADSRAILELVDDEVRGPEDVPRFYLDLLQPALREVGALWETGELSVAQEHLVSAMAVRSMTAAYPHVASVERTRGRAVVTAGPSELHELGARMVADLLELDGWEVAYLGANTPSPEVIALAVEHQARLLAISVTMPFHLPAAAALIRDARATPELAGTHILVGGQPLVSFPELARTLGADGTAAHAGDLRDLTATLAPGGTR